MSLPRPCRVCGKPSKGATCPAHSQRQARGYDSEYERNRRLMIRLARYHGWSCVICGKGFGPTEQITAEHVTPVGMGGGGSIGNLGPAHARCNYSRRASR